jgi:O-antigen ligase
VPGAAELASRRDRSAAARWAFGAVFVSLVAFLPSSDFWASARPALTLRMAIVLLALAAGLPLLVRLAFGGDRTARVVLAFVVWAAIAAAASGAPLAWTGEYGAGTGALFVVALGACWAIGRVLPSDGRPAVGVAVLAGAAVNAGFGVLQPVLHLSQTDRAFFDGRSTGLLGNPVFLGALCAAALAFVPAVLRRRPAAGLLLATLLAAATQLSGTRTALVVLVLVGGWAAVQCGRRLGIALAVAVVIGVFFGGALHDDATPTASARVEAGSAGPRVDYWHAGLRAVRSRPVAGYGPGRFRAATASHRTLAIVRKGGPDVLYADAHNLFMEYLVTTGVVGLALLLAWLVLAMKTLRRPVQPAAAVAAGALLAVHLLEPQHLILTPLMVLLAAVAGPRSDAGRSRPLVAATVLLGVVALAVGARVVSGDLLFHRARADFDLARMERASARLWPWPDPVSAEIRIHAYRAKTEKDAAELDTAVAAARRARRREPENPIRTLAVAQLLGQQAHPAAAAAEYARALMLDPWSKLALTGRAAELARLHRPVQGRACRQATELRRPDRQLEGDRARCLVRTNAERERP